jgi:C4-dicarboxylate transporter DctQ subunit
MKLITKFLSIHHWTTRIFAVLAAICLAFVTVSICLEVVMRYFFHNPLIWVAEISEISLLFILFLSTSWVLKKEGHVKIDFLLNRFKPRGQALVEIISSIIIVIICGILVWYGAQVTWDQWLRGAYRPTLLDIPNTYVLIIIPIGSLLLLIQGVLRIHKYLREFRILSDKKEVVETTQNI